MNPAQQDDLAIGYGRYSRDTQDSLEDQHAMNEESALDIGVKIVERFGDEAVSRTVQDRAELMKALAYLETHRDVRVLLIPALDRLIGGLDQHVTIFRTLKRLKVRLYIDGEHLDYTNEEALTQAEQASLNSVAEVRRGRKRVRKALRVKNRNGRYTSRPPFGLRMKPLVGPDGRELPPGAVLLDEKGRVVRSGELDRDPETFRYLTPIFERVAAGEPRLSIARWLESEGVPSKSGEVLWRIDSITRIVRNRTYIGERTYGVTRIVHDYDGRTRVRRDDDDKEIIRTTTTLGPVVDPELFRRANEALDAQASRNERAPKNVAGRTHAPRVLSDLVYCGRCGAKMSCRQDSGKLKKTGERRTTWRWVCTGPIRRQQGHTHPKGQPDKPYCTVGHSFAEKRLLDALSDEMEKIGKRIGTTEWREVTPATPVPDVEERARAEDAQQKARDAIVRVRNGHEHGIYDDDDALARIAAQEAIIAQAEETLSALKAAQAETATPMPAARRVELTSALRPLLANALVEEETLEETTEVREAINRRLAQHLVRVEVDSPHVRVDAHAAP
jgi:DNA invertase Pin-like site-specific DNA recombinase